MPSLSTSSTSLKSSGRPMSSVSPETDDPGDLTNFVLPDRTDADLPAPPLLAMLGEVDEPKNGIGGDDGAWCRAGGGSDWCERAPPPFVCAEGNGRVGPKRPFGRWSWPYGDCLTPGSMSGTGWWTGRPNWFDDSPLDPLACRSMSVEAGPASCVPMLLRKRAAMGRCSTDAADAVRVGFGRDACGGGDRDEAQWTGEVVAVRGWCECESGDPREGDHSARVGDPTCWRGGRSALMNVSTSWTRSLTYRSSLETISHRTSCLVRSLGPRFISRSSSAHSLQLPGGPTKLPFEWLVCVPARLVAPPPSEWVECGLHDLVGSSWN